MNRIEVPKMLEEVWMMPPTTRQKQFHTGKVSTDD